MTVHLVIVLGLAMATAAAAEPISRRLAPRTATLLLTVGGLLSFGLVIWVLLALSVGGLGELDWLSTMGLCPPVTALSHDVPLPVAAVTTLMLGAIAARAAQRSWDWHHLTPNAPHQGLAVLAIDEPVAYAVPGRPGGIVASRGLLTLLDGDERRALLAHEQAHLDLGHHRYLRASEMTASFPLLGPLARAVRFSTERWADEEAASAVGDRRIVARALSRAALAGTQPAPSGLAGLLGAGMSERVAELLDDPPGRLDLAQGLLVAASVVGLVAATGLTLRLHDLLAVLAPVCGAG